MSARRQRWEIRPAAPAAFVEQLGLHPLLATLLYQRGLHEPATARAFLTADYNTGLHNPFTMRGMADAAGALQRLSSAMN